MKSIDQLSDDAFEQRLREAVALPDAPPALLHAARSLWQARPLGGVLRRLQALLAFDSWAPSPTLAVRGVRSGTRQLLFTAEGRDIDLRIQPHAGAWALAGQVLGPDETGRVEISGGASAELDPQGAFRLDGVAPGSYVLTLHLSGDAITLPAVEVGSG